MTKYKLLDGKKVEMTSTEIKEMEDFAKAIAAGKADDDLQTLRNIRNNLLSETDYMGLSDITMSSKWKTYRQELRDITKTFKSMGDKDFKFPTKPE